MVSALERFTGRECSHDDLCDALGDLAANGEVRVLGDHQDVYVVIGGQVIVHAARDWLEWAGGNWAAASRN